MCNEREEAEAVVYRVVPGFPHRLVGTDGSYWDRVNIRLIPKKYVRAVLVRDGVRVFTSLHQIVLTTFEGPCPEGMECCHNDGNPHSNFLKNLRWDTPLNNCVDREKHGVWRAAIEASKEKQKKYNRFRRAKLSDEQIPVIREMFRSGMTVSQIGEQLGVTKATISLAIRGDTWAHIPDPYRTTMRKQGECAKGSRSYDSRTTDQFPPDGRSEADDRRT